MTAPGCCDQARRAACRSAASARVRTPSASPSSARRTRASTICFRSGASAPASALRPSSVVPMRPRFGETRPPEVFICRILAPRTSAVRAPGAARSPPRAPAGWGAIKSPHLVGFTSGPSGGVRHRHSVRAGAPSRSIHLPLRARAGQSPRRHHRLDNFELASRLSFFLWSGMPDEQRPRRRPER
jgi:hypothetical protein